MPCHALDIILDLGTTWPVTEARQNDSHQNQHGIREELGAPLSQVWSSTGQVRAGPDALRWMRLAVLNVGDRVPGVLNKDGQHDSQTMCHLSQARAVRPAGNPCHAIPMHMCQRVSTLSWC